MVVTLYYDLPHKHSGIIDSRAGFPVFDKSDKNFDISFREGDGSDDCFVDCRADFTGDVCPLCRWGCKVDI